MSNPMDILSNTIDRLTINPPSNPFSSVDFDINQLPLVKPPKYEETYFKRMADDIKTPINQQLTAIEQIADSAKTQAEASVNLADSAKIHADLSLAKSKKADIKGWIAIFISLLALLLEFAINHEAIIDFFTKLLNQ
ncbi:MAG: hypothetical protein IJV71_11920 [Lachnospiraceae bacterium]|nr:hypothetical protein [Lachnospiraceae bacterium]